MQIIQVGDEVRRYVWSIRATGKTVGIVPTMGALHDGHLSLVRNSVQRCDHTIVTIFVNPTQFGPGEDLKKYPRTFDADCAAVKDAGASLVFAPTAIEMYPPGFSTFVEPPDIALPLEGEFRPGHFRGVTTVVMKLFQLSPATHAFFGSKDFQQLKVIQAIVNDLNVGIEIVPCDIIREPDGLALSSRNRYLSPKDRLIARSLSNALSIAQSQFDQGERDVKTIETQMRKALADVTKIDYAAIVDADTLLPIQKIDHLAHVLIAAHVGTTRLIDNRPLKT